MALDADGLGAGEFDRLIEQLHERTGLSKTDIVNRAVSLYAFATEQLASGQDLLVRDRQTGEVQRIQLL